MRHTQVVTFSWRQMKILFFVPCTKTSLGDKAISYNGTFHIEQFITVNEAMQDFIDIIIIIIVYL